MASFWGSPGTTQVIQTRGTSAVRPPMFDFARWLGSQLPGLMNKPFPTYQGRLDPGLSPTLQRVIRGAQGYNESSPPEILGGVQGSIGRFMSPTFINPWNDLFAGGSGMTRGPMGGASGGSDAGGGMSGGADMGSGMGGAAMGSNPWAVAGAPMMFGGANNYF